MKGKVIITGAGKGIGYELCKCFSAEGWKTIGISRSISSLESLPRVISIECDLSIWKNMDDLLMKCELENDDSEFRILIHNAGLLLKTPFEDAQEDEILRMLKVNYVAPLRLTQVFLPWLKGGSKSHIIYVGSMGGFQGSGRYSGLSIYSSTKSAIASLSESLAEEFKDTKMRFNTLALGAVDTEMLQLSLPNYASEVSAEQMAKWIYTFSIQAYGLINGKVIPVAGLDPEI
jgi:3-oxoacyl-[acyl-carrier protein] reductase